MQYSLRPSGYSRCRALPRPACFTAAFAKRVDMLQSVKSNATSVCSFSNQTSLVTCHALGLCGVGFRLSLFLPVCPYAYTSSLPCRGSQPQSLNPKHLHGFELLDISRPCTTLHHFGFTWTPRVGKMIAQNSPKGFYSTYYAGSGRV